MANLIRLAVYIHFNLNNPMLLLQMPLSPYRIVIRPLKLRMVVSVELAFNIRWI